jgi:invasion protein IalB
MPRFQLAALAALVLLTPAVGDARQTPPPEPPTTTFKDWTVVCDNLRNCEADGFSVEGAEKPAILTLTRGGAPGAPVGVAIVLMNDMSAAPPGTPLALVVDDRPLLTVPMGGEQTATLAAAQVGPLLRAGRNATTLSVRLGDQDLGAVSLAGMVAALRLVDEQQARVGTVTAILAKGSAPLSAVPPQPAPPVVRRAPAVAQTVLPSQPPASVRALAAKAKCDAGQDEAPEAHRLSMDKLLWRVPCGAGAYNSTALFVIVEDKGGKARVAPLEGVADGLVDGGAYDPRTRTLEAANLGRSVGDCGDSTTWTWTGQDFLLTKMTAMPVCRGQASWPISFQARVE